MLEGVRSLLEPWCNSLNKKFQGSPLVWWESYMYYRCGLWRNGVKTDAIPEVRLLSLIFRIRQFIIFIYCFGLIGYITIWLSKSGFDDLSALFKLEHNYLFCFNRTFDSHHTNREDLRRLAPTYIGRFQKQPHLPPPLK